MALSSLNPFINNKDALKLWSFFYTKEGQFC